MKCSAVILKVTDFPVKSFYEMSLWGESLIARLIKCQELLAAERQEIFCSKCIVKWFLSSSLKKK